jgi:putative PIN family toxin of toxin-antitoxin system
MRFVLDTNVLVSSLLFRGHAAAVHAAWTADRFVPMVSRQAMDEYTRVLAYPKFGLSRDEIAWLVRHELLRWAEPVHVTSRVDTIRADPPDNRFLELAADGKADLLVGGDSHLLDLGTWRKIPILTVRGFAERLG